MSKTTCTYIVNMKSHQRDTSTYVSTVVKHENEPMYGGPNIRCFFGDNVSK